jgi:adenine-specific DNA methylase
LLLAGCNINASNRNDLSTQLGKDAVVIPKECKRLAEVDFPIAVVSKHSAREKSIRHGHPSTLHLWWARRPLASCRSMLLALLLPDPCDEQCPKDFKKKARELLAKVQGNPGPSDEDLRKALLKFIGDFANWDLSAEKTYLEVSRGLVKAAHPEETPLVVDPFAGGGSIPLEALRLGCETFASDLNPVACLILKVMLEDIPRHGPKLAEELRRVGAEIKKAAEKELAEFYPTDPGGAKPIAYLWARTVRCEAPNCGAEIPLMRSFWLCKKASRKRALRPIVDVGATLRGRPHHGQAQGPAPTKTVRFEIFEPKTDRDVHEGTVTRAKATCLCCGTVLSPDRVRAQLSAQRGGADVIFDEKGNRSGGARLLAVVTLTPGQQGRNYRLPIERDYQAVWKAQKRLKAILDKWECGGKKGFCPVPDEPMDLKDSTTLAGRGYGATEWGNLFTSRQAMALTALGGSLRKTIANDKNGVPSELLALVVSRCSDFNSSLTSWANGGEFVRSTFGRQALPMVWDFCETYPFSSESGGFDGALDWVYRVVNHLTTSSINCAQVQEADACESPLPDETAAVWFTDPPYYDAISYALLSDFFFVWLKRTLPGHPLLRDRFDSNNPLTPKFRECIQTGPNESTGRVKDKAFFEDTMGHAFREGCRVLKDQGIGCVVFAHKTTEGWEALLSGVITGKLVIVGSWPIATERGSRQIARDAAALQTSIHLICRPRPEDAPVGDWGEVLRELPKRVGDWMERLQQEGIRGADLVFACIGPALEIFSQYSKVETAEGMEVKLPQFLEKVWEVVGRLALEQVLGTAEAQARNGMAGALEEDARLTALFLWTLQSTNGNSNDAASDESEEAEDEEEETPKKKKTGFSLIFDVARRFAQPLGIHLPEWEGRIIETEKGVVRLLSVKERAKQLFGEDGSQAVADQLERSRPGSAQLTLFPQRTEGAVPEIKGRGGKRKKKGTGAVSDEALRTRHEATTLDRIHAAMLLQAGGRTNALRALLKAEQDRSPDFLRLANALSALYPKESEEKRLLDAMLLAMPR